VQSRRKEEFLTTEKCRGACRSRLRGSNQTSTLIPDVDNAAVGKNIDSVAGGYHKRYSPVFYFS